MMTTGADESGGGGNTSNASVSAKTISPMMMIDESYEFSAPRFYDFIKGETDEDMRKAELWFDTALTYAPSPFTQRVKTRRPVKVESLCDFSEAEQLQKATEASDSASASCPIESDQTQVVVAPTEVGKADSIPETDSNKDSESNQVDVIPNTENVSGECPKEIARNNEKLSRSVSSKIIEAIDGENRATEAYNTPKPAILCQKKGGVLTESKKKQLARHIASLVKNPSVLKSKTHLQSSQVKSVKPSSVKKDSNLKKNNAGTCNFAHENQAIKRQKLDEGRSRQILNVKPPQPLPHKSRLGLTASSNVGSSSVSRTQNKERKLYVREPAATVPFVSTAEIMKKFQSSTRELSLPHSLDNAASGFQRKGKLTLTRPKEPELETSQRNRSVRVKSTVELEEEMMAKIPKFKARPLNKKILEAPSIPAVHRSTPQPPEFQEFHLETAARAHHNSDTASEISISTNVSHQNNQWKPHLLTTPKGPHLQTSMRARPTTVKSSWELEKEELEKIPKFRARPINRKIFESKGEMGLQCHAKKHVTIPQEFHFATDERIPPPSAIVNMFDKLSLNSEPRHDNPKPKNTMPNAFHLRTEERGAKKEKKFVTEIVHKKIEEEIARIPKANPYPYTTDFPVVPPKPAPKSCTKPEPFQLESLMRHEEEMQREREEQERMEREEAQRRLFKAQPVLKEDPIPVPAIERKPLTQVQQFNLHADHRAAERSEFDKKVKEKEMMYKRYREECEAARMIEEEKALKQLRRTLVPHARPVPNFDRPFCPGRSSKEPTKAKSPNLRVLRRREQHNRMVVTAATSSAATNMR